MSGKKQPTGSRHRVIVYLNDEMLGKLTELSKEFGISRSAIMSHSLSLLFTNNSRRKAMSGERPRKRRKSRSEAVSVVSEE